MRRIAAFVWILVLIAAAACPLMAGCNASAAVQTDDCCQKGACTRQPQQHEDNCPYKMRAAHQAEAKFELNFEQAQISPVLTLGTPSVFAQASTPPALTVLLSDSDRYLLIRVLRI